MSSSSGGGRRSLRAALCRSVVLQAGLLGCTDDDGADFSDVTLVDPSGGSGGEAAGDAGASGSGTQSNLPGGIGGMGASGGSGPNAGGARKDAGSEPGDGAGPCGPCPCESGQFGPPEPVTGLALEGDLAGPSLSASGEELFFSSVNGDESIFSATRTGRTAAFSAATLVPNLDAGATDEGTPFLTFDGLSLYFYSTRPGPGTMGDRDLWVATRSSPSGDFSEPAVVAALNGPDIEHLPRLTRDELTILFVSGRDSPNAFSNIWIAQRGSRSEDFGPASELPGVNTSVREEGFSLSPDGLTLYFASNRSVALDMDLWVATRPDPSAAFDPPTPLDVLNTAEEEIDPALSSDGSELFFASDRNGSLQLFRSPRSCAP